MAFKNIPKTSKLANYTKTGDLPLCVFPIWRGTHQELDVHAHDYHELVIVSGGNAIHIANGISTPIQAGDVLLLSPGCYHAYDRTKDLALWNVLYRRNGLFVPTLDGEGLSLFRSMFMEALPGRNQEKPLLHLAKKDLHSILELLGKLSEELHGAAPGRQLRTLGLFIELVTSLARHGLKTTEEGLRSLLVSDALTLMNAKFAEKLSIEDLAAKAKMSKRNFFLQFKKCMGCAPMEHLQEIRLNKAAGLLRETTLSISEIALACGFCDANHLCKKFRQRYGTTPRRHRLME